MPILDQTRRLALPTGNPDPAVVYEALDDKDARVWRKLGAMASIIDLEPGKREEAIRTMESMFLSSPMAKLITRWVVDFLVGKGFHLNSSDPQANRVLQEFWTHPVNDMPTHQRTHVQELAVYGELVFVQKTSPTGFVGITFVPSTQIADIVEVEGYPGEADKVILKDEDETPLRVIRWNPQSGRYEGDCFLMRANRLGGHLRGHPEMIPLLDWVNVFETFAYNKLERDSQQTGVWWDITLEGKTEEEIREWEQMYGGIAPRAGSAIYHNERMQYNIVQPKPSIGVSRDAGFFKDLLMSLSGLGNFGTARDNAGELLDPAINSLSARQYDIHLFFTLIGRFVVQEAIRGGKLPRGEYDVGVRAPRLGVRDVQRSSGAVLRVAQSLETAQEHGWVDQKEAGRVYRNLLARLDMLDEDPGATSAPSGESQEGEA